MTSMRKSAMAILATVLIAPTAGLAQDAYRSKALSRASAYHTNGDAFFVRGGYVFDNTEEDFDDLAGFPGAADLADSSAVYGSIGARAKIARAGASMFGLEFETLVARDTVEISDGVGVFADISQWVVAPQANARWQYNFHGVVAPYASFGVGPAVVIQSIDSTIGQFRDTSVVFSYNGRAGLEFGLADRFGVETGYRYLGVTDEGTAGAHAAELGLNFKF